MSVTRASLDSELATADVEIHLPDAALDALAANEEVEDDGYRKIVCLPRLPGIRKRPCIYVKGSVKIKLE